MSYGAGNRPRPGVHLRIVDLNFVLEHVRAGADMLEYEVEVNDSQMYTRPWTVAGAVAHESNPFELSGLTPACPSVVANSNCGWQSRRMTSQAPNYSSRSSQRESWSTSGPGGRRRPSDCAAWAPT